MKDKQPSTQKTAHRATEIATDIPTGMMPIQRTLRGIKKINGAKVYLYIITFCALLAPFLHLFAVDGQKGYFGFPYMSSFLNAVGWALCAFFLGLLLKFAAKRIDTEYAKPFTFISYLIIGLGIYYAIYVMLPVYTLNIKDYHISVYFIGVGVVSVMGVVITTLLGKAVTFAETKLRKSIALFFDWSYSLDPYIDAAKKIDFLKSRIKLTSDIVAKNE